MKIQNNVNLKNLLTMKIGGIAKNYTQVFSEDEVKRAVDYAKNNNLDIWVLGDGSNTIAKSSEYNGLIVHNKIDGINYKEQDGGYLFSVGSGVIWDDFVKKTVEKDLSGVEALSMIPGSVGASPVQNIGAYGQEVSETIVKVRYFDVDKGIFCEKTNNECEFKYRDSFFKKQKAGKCIITRVDFLLHKKRPKEPFYASVEKYCSDTGTEIETVQDLRGVVVAVRSQRRLPNPKEIPNSGSFFKNAIVNSDVKQKLAEKYPEMSFYEMKNNKWKIATGWMIDYLGYRGKEVFGIVVYEKNALVLTNPNGVGYLELSLAKKQIIDDVYSVFGVKIEQEPVEI